VLLWIALGGALGAVLRFLTASWVQKKLGPFFPWGTLVVNALGSFLIGVFSALLFEVLAAPPKVRAFLITGFLGAFTTFSTFSYETVSLLSEGEVLKAFIYAAATNLLCFAATFLGLFLVRTLLT